MVPFKLHESFSVQAALDNEPTSCCAEESTLLRWKRAWKAKKQQTELALKSLLAKEKCHTWNLLDETSLLTNIRTKIKHWLSFVTKLLVAAGFEAPT